MKRKVLAVLSISTLIISASMCVSFSLNNEEYKVEAYTTAALPTTIDLNDSTSEEIKGYYANLKSLGENERKGTNLLKNLKPILKNNQKYYSYDTDNNGRKIWQAYEITDRDWVKSPASSISGYDATTNTIKNYTYGTSASNPGSNPYIHALYVDRNVNHNVKAWAKSGTTTSHGGNNEWCIDREHIWAKSNGFEDVGAGGARGDLMHLWAGDSYVNSALHSNYYFGYVDTNKEYFGGDKAKFDYVKGNLAGYSLTLGGSVTVFEPQDCDKGDIARAVFYMVARYNYLSGSDSDGINSDNPNLEMTNDLSDWKNSGYASTTTKTGKMGVLTDLLEWNEIDPPDEWEIHRNNLLYKNFTNNRNPFIDYPEWANIIWGDEEGYANPDKANGIEGGVETEVQLSATKLDIDLETSTTATLIATAPNGIDITWSIADSTVASLNKTTTQTGEAVTVTPLKTGETTITASATIDAQLVQATCSLKVYTPIHVTSVSLDKSEASLKVGNTLKLNATVNPSDATNKSVTWSSSDTNIATVDADGKVTAKKAGKVTITVTSNDGNKSATCALTVEAKGIQDYLIYIIIGVAALVVIIIVIIILANSKKARKKVAKMAKKQVKKQIKSSTRNSSKKK